MSTSSFEQAGRDPTPGEIAATGLHYLAAGHGPTVVFLHGLGAFKEIWWGTMRALAPDFRTLAFDWPGHGTSPASDDYDFELLAEQVVASTMALHINQFMLVGHSLGGNVAARLALRHPELVTRLVLVAPALEQRFLARGLGRRGQPPLSERNLHLVRQLSRPFSLFGQLVPHDHAGGLLAPLARRVHYAARIEAQVLHRYTTTLWASSLGERLQEITQPTLIIAGTRDPLVAPAQAHAAAAMIHGAQVAMMPATMHNPMDERPAQFQGLIRDFLMAANATAT